MNKIILSVCVLSALIGSGVTLIVSKLTSSSKLVYVDSNKLLTASSSMQAARKVFQQKASGWQANIDTLSSEVERQLRKYEKESPKMTPRERELSKELINTKKKSLIDYQRAISTQAQEEDKKMTTAVLNEINTYLKKYGETNGYTVILAATDYGNVAYADAELDITEKVIEGLNKEFTGK
jgi:outer membrane protein